MSKGRKTVYNKDLVTEEKWEEVNNLNKLLLMDFIKFMRATKKSKETIYQYEKDLRIFFVWLVENGRNKEFYNLKKIDIINFQSWMLEDCGLSSSIIRRRRSSLSSLSIYIESVLDDEYPTFRNIINKIPAPVSNPVRDKTIITFEKAESVADMLIEKGKYQLACYLMVAVFSGLRKQELSRLLVKDFTTDIKLMFDGSLYQTTPIQVKGRGEKKAEKYVWNRCDKWLKLWLNFREENKIDCEYLFCRKVGEGYSKMLVSTSNSFATSLNSYFDEPFYTHATRHTLATELTRSGVPIEVVQFLLDHKSAETSKLYIDISDAENMEKHAEFFSGKKDKIEKRGLGDFNEKEAE